MQLETSWAKRHKRLETLHKNHYQPQQCKTLPTYFTTLTVHITV